MVAFPADQPNPVNVPPEKAKAGPTPPKVESA
jgi:hypothetical protein